MWLTQIRGGGGECFGDLLSGPVLYATDKTTSKHSSITHTDSIEPTSVENRGFYGMRNQIQNCSGSDSAILGQTGFLLVQVLTIQRMPILRGTTAVA